MLTHGIWLRFYNDSQLSAILLLHCYKEQFLNICIWLLMFVQMTIFVEWFNTNCMLYNVLII